MTSEPAHPGWVSGNCWADQCSNQTSVTRCSCVCQQIGQGLGTEGAPWHSGAQRKGAEWISSHTDQDLKLLQLRKCLNYAETQFPYWRSGQKSTSGNEV